MLDILTIVHDCADAQTAARIRRTCRRLAVLMPQPILYTGLCADYEYLVGKKLHRLDGPAMKDAFGHEYWYRGGVVHREYHPYIKEYYEAWKIDGVYHREVGPSISDNKREVWYFRGKLHRRTGPASTWLGNSWIVSGKQHRLDDCARNNSRYIRGICHSISRSNGGLWVIDGSIIRFKYED